MLSVVNKQVNELIFTKKNLNTARGKDENKKEENDYVVTNSGVNFLLLLKEVILIWPEY